MLVLGRLRKMGVYSEPLSIAGLTALLFCEISEKSTAESITDS